MKKIIILLVIYLDIAGDIAAQQNIREDVYVHINSPTYLSGETMYIAAYCNSRLTNEPSGISRILYVELLGKDGPVHQQKIELVEGRGSSDFFISSSIPTGQYYLLAFTRWMKNFDDLFQSPVLIINPFESYSGEADTAVQELEIYTLQGSLIAGLENVFAMKFNSETPLNYKGRLINKSGETTARFIFDGFGMSKVKFIPERGQRYQVILEDDKGQISIYDLPEVSEQGGLVSYSEENELLRLRYQEAGKIPELVKLELSLGGIILHSADVAPNQYYTIPGTLSDGVYHTRYFDDKDNLLAERPLLISHTRLKWSKINKTYRHRQQVSFDPELEPGTYSVSVRKNLSPKFNLHRHAIWNNTTNPLSQSPVPTSIYLSSNEPDLEAFMLASSGWPCIIDPKEAFLLPEVREELLEGSIKSKNGKPVKGEKISLTFPGEPFQIRIGESKNDFGEFIIPFQSSVIDTEAMLTALDFNNQYEINIKDPFLEKYPPLNFNTPGLDSLAVAEIVAKSVRVQIENAYYDFSKRQARNNEWLDVVPFHDKWELNHYKRFPTLRETITEFVITAKVRANREYAIKTTYFPGLGQPEFPPLVLLDGVPVKGEKIIEFSPYKIKSINVLPNRYFLGPLVADGVVGLQTWDSDLADFQLDLSSNHKKIPVKGVARQESYHFPDYSDNLDRHRADQRDQLYWNPAFSPLGNSNSEITFFTSDVDGEYEIVIEGFTSERKPFSKVYFFSVE